MGAGDRPQRNNKKKKQRFSPSQTIAFSSPPNMDPSTNSPITQTPTKPSSPNPEIDIQHLIEELPDTAEGQLSKRILATISSLTNALIQELKSENDTLKKRIEVLERDKVNKRLNDNNAKIVSVETEVNRLEQYGRRNNVEFSGFPEAITDKDLEKSVINLLSEIDVVVEEKDIEACHRIGRRSDKGPRRTVVRFVNRKNCYKIFANKKKLKGLKPKKVNLGGNAIYANYSLCPAYRKLWYRAKLLFQAQRIHSFWISNGTLKLRVTDSSEPLLIEHQSQLSGLFPNFSFNSPSANT